MNKFTRFLKKIQPKAKYILGILGIAAIVSQGAFAFTKLSASGPQFNIFPNDPETFLGYNPGGTVPQDPISGTSSDTFQGVIYYHNGVPDTIAENTRIKVTIPARTSGKTAVLGTTISADNASPASISDNLTVNLTDQDANLSLVQGSVKWFPDKNQHPGNIEFDLPNGQTGNEITGANGINIGGIQGCWNYAGYVTFDFKATPITNIALDVQKTVKNVTAGETSYVELTNARSSNVVEFKIDAENTGNQIADNLKIKDTMPLDMTFVPGSMKISRDGSSTPENVTDANASLVFGNGWTAGNLQMGANKKDVLTFQASAPASIATEHQVTNTVRISSGTLSDSDNAKVNLLPNTSPNIVFHKAAKNLTTGANALQSGNVKALDAKPGDVIEYTLITKNTGNAASNGYVIKDGINDVLQEANFVSASDTGHVVNTGLADNDAKQIVYTAVNIVPDQTVTRTFTVKVMDPLPNNQTNGNDFDHKLYNLYGDTILVTIAIPAPPVQLPILHISKNVRDFTVNELNFVKSNTATSGDSLEYLIAFLNTGNAPADQITFSDVLPANFTYIPGTTVLSMNGGQEHTMIDGIVGNGVLLDTIGAGDSGYIKIRVISASGIAANTVLTNTANLTDNGVTISDTAATTFKVPVVLTTAPLPRTGADSVTVAAIVSAMLAAAGALVYRRFA